MSERYEYNCDYFRKVALNCSKELDWRSIWICRSREFSNDVRFESALWNSITMELSGTASHLTVMDGIRDENATRIGDICQIPAGAQARFAWTTLGQEQQSLILKFDNDIFANYCPEIAGGDFSRGHLRPCSYESHAELGNLVSLLARELEPERRRGRLFSDAIIRSLAIEIASQCWTRKPLRLLQERSIDARIKRAIEFVEAHFRDDIALADLTMASGLNATQLNNLFKRATGRTPYAYVVKRRVDEALHLLKVSRLTLCEIAQTAGFYDQQQMTHAFRRLLGHSPKFFRIEH